MHKLNGQGREKWTKNYSAEATVNDLVHMAVYAQKRNVFLHIYLYIHPSKWLEHPSPTHQAVYPTVEYFVVMQLDTICTSCIPMSKRSQTFLPMFYSLTIKS